jgi:hypothetical protein
MHKYFYIATIVFLILMIIDTCFNQCDDDTYELESFHNENLITNIKPIDNV